MSLAELCDMGEPACARGCACAHCWAHINTPAAVAVSAVRRACYAKGCLCYGGRRTQSLTLCHRREGQ